MINIYNPIKLLRLSILFLVILVCSGLEMLHTAQAAPQLKGYSFSLQNKQTGHDLLFEKHTKKHAVIICEEDVEDEDETPSCVEQPIYIVTQQRVFTICSVSYRLPLTFYSTNPLFILFRNLRI